MRLSVVTATAITTLALAGCGSAADSRSASGVRGTASSPVESATDADAPSGSSTGSAAACGQQTTPHPELAGQLPAGFPTLAGWQATEVVNQGQTRAVSGVLRGEAADLLTVRDAVVSQLAVAGYAKTGSDQEPGYEAEADFSGPRDVSVKVRPLCRDYLVLSYAVRQ